VLKTKHQKEQEEFEKEYAEEMKIVESWNEEERHT